MVSMVAQAEKTDEKESPTDSSPTDSGDPGTILNSQPAMNIAIIAHVDHGKTTLTERLSGKWTDTHSEELKRGITIRLGYADVVIRKCPSCPEPTCYTTKDACA